MIFIPPFEIGTNDAAGDAKLFMTCQRRDLIGFESVELLGVEANCVSAVSRPRLDIGWWGAANRRSTRTLPVK
jgi:hypothetical protein